MSARLQNCKDYPSITFCSTVVPLHSGHLLSATGSCAAGRLCCTGDDLAAAACCSLLQHASAQLLR